MTRVTDVDFLREAFAQETGVAIILLLTITHESLSEPILISTDPTSRVEETATEIVYGTVSNAKNYLFMPIRIKPPSEDDEGPGNMRLEIDNITRELVPSIRSLTSPPSCQVDIITSDDLDNVIASWPEYLMTNLQYDKDKISAELTLELLHNEPFPAGSFNPSEFPGLF